MAFKDNTLFYTTSILEHGISAKGVRWKSSYNQYKRFEILTSFITNNISKSTIVDDHIVTGKQIGRAHV